MLAKSVLEAGNVPVPAGSVGRARQFVSLLVLVASLVSLGLIVHENMGAPLLSGGWQSVFGVHEAAAETAEPAAPKAAVPPADDGRYRRLAEFLSKRYRVSADMAYDLVGHAHAVGSRIGVDPLLILAVVGVESGFNPIAESVKGAKGLMQVIPRYHADKLMEFGGEKAVFDPATNIQVGAQILKEYLRATGHIDSALQMYAGALSDYEDQYATKVRNEKQRLLQALRQAGPAKPARKGDGATRVSMLR